MNKQQLAAKIWQSANKMRSKIEANDYKDYILGFVFYKYLSEQQIRFLKENDFDDAAIVEYVNENSLETVQFVQDSLGCFISYEHLFSTWIAKGRDFDVADVRDALSAFARLVSPAYKKVYDKIFDTLQTGLSKLGDSAANQTKAISDLIHLIDDIPMDGKQDYDVLGFIYEYLIGMFAANAGKKAGEFYTPHEVSLLMSEIIAEHLKDQKEIKIYDPTSGSGSLLINIGSSVAKHQKTPDSIKYYAQELKENTFNLTRMNLIMRGIKPANIMVRNADTLEDDWPYFDENDPVGTYEPLYVDAVVSNPPYSQAWDSSHKESDPRYAGFGLAPKTKADFAFLLHDLYHLKPNGIMAIVLPHGVLFRGGEEEKIRKNLIEKNHIDAIIGLPANIFFGTGIPTIVMILRQKRERNDVLFVDASKGFIKDGKQNKLQAAHIRKIVDTVVGRKNVDKYSRAVSLTEIQSQGYNLNIPRYVDSSDTPEQVDIYATMFGDIPQAEIDELHTYWQALPSLQTALFVQQNNTPYYALNTDNIAQTLAENKDVQAFEHQVKTAFANFDDELDRTLIASKNTLHIAHTETALNREIFARLADIALIDPYVAYQHFADLWQTISADLEMIQTEGETAITQVDANMVTKKKNGKDVEEQDGYVGHILPFELVQAVHFAKELADLTACEQRLSQISAELESLLENLSEEDKESPAVNDDGTAFVAAELTKILQTALESEYGKLKKAEFSDKLDIHQFDENSPEHSFQAALKLFAEEKALKTKQKKLATDLHLATKAKIESLTPTECDNILKLKWITPLVQSMQAQPKTVLKTLQSKITHLADKYATTFGQIAEEINEKEQALSLMIDELVGDEFDLQGLAEFKRLIGE